MANDEHVAILKRGVTEWNNWRQKNREEWQPGKEHIWPDLSEADLSGLELTDAYLTGSNMNGADLTDATLRNAQIEGVELKGATLVRANLTSANLGSSYLTGSDCTEANFTGANFFQAVLSNANFTKAIFTHAGFAETLLDGVNFSAANLESVILVNAHLVKVRFCGANLSGTNLAEANLAEANLTETNLKGANMSNADLTVADMLGASFDQDTSLSNATVTGLRMDRYGLECLKEYGGLSVGARMSMKINDDVARLRATYSGFLQWLHLCAVIGFVFPYIWFILYHWGEAEFYKYQPENYMPLWKAFLLFIYNGGVNWENGPNFSWSFVLFWISLCYNLLRILLLFITKKLELAQEASGLPAMFSLKNSVFFNVTCEHLFLMANIGFYINLLVVFLNLCHFFMMDIPV